MNRLPGYLPLVLGLAVFGSALSGCNGDDVGVRCSVPDDGTSTSSSAFTIAQTNECEKRLCVARSGTATAVPRCTKVCSSDGDCPGSGPNCNEGFICRVAAVKAGQLTQLDCCKLCLCKDDLSVEERQTDLNAQTCEQEGIVPNCPSF